MADSKIEWTDTTWNPVVGCARVSAGCEHCYAETMAARHVLMSEAQGRKSPYLPVVDVERRRWNRKAVFLPDRLGDPLLWRKPRRVFVNSMSDLFHEDISFEQVAAVFGVMAATPQLTYQVLTKRAKRMREFFAWLDELAVRQKSQVFQDDEIGWVTRQILHSAALREGVNPYFKGGPPSGAMGDGWPLPNVHLGVSVEDQRAADERIPVLLACPAALRFLSVEPLLGAVDLWPSFAVVDSHGEPSGPRCNADGSPAIGWVIVGGESGPGARACEVGWIRSIVSQCSEAGVPVFVKQLGAKPVAEDEVDDCPVCKGEAVPPEALVDHIDCFGHDIGDDGSICSCGASLPACQKCSSGRVFTAPPKMKDRKGGNPDEWPEDLRVRQLPGGAP